MLCFHCQLFGRPQHTFLQAGPFKNSTNKFGETPLLAASKKGHADEASRPGLAYIPEQLPTTCGLSQWNLKNAIIEPDQLEDKLKGQKFSTHTVYKRTGSLIHMNIKKYLQCVTHCHIYVHVLNT